jgi:hypothetical protein
VLRIISRSAVLALVSLPLAGLGLAGCGFVSANGKSDIKPSGFVLLGSATVPLDPDSAPAAGSTCTAPAGVTDVAENTQVTVSDPAGKAIARGVLNAGVAVRNDAATTCQFSFTIRAVPGDYATYAIAVGNRPAQTFSGPSLRNNTPATLTITPNS